MRLWDFFRIRKRDSADTAPMRAFLARNVSVSDENASLSGLSFKMNPGDSICIGYSSADEKNLMLKLLCGEIAPSKGSLIYDGSIQSQAELSQISGLFTHNMRTLEQAQATLDKFANENHKLWLIDQPCDSLPGAATKEFAIKVGQQAKNRTTIFFSNNRAIARRCNHVHVLRNGRLEDYYSASKSPELNPFNNSKILDETHKETKTPAKSARAKRKLNPLVFRSKTADTGDIEEWIGWHRDRIEPVVIRKATTQEGLDVLNREREALGDLSSLRVARMYESGSDELNLFEYVNIDPLAQTAPLNSFQICALAADLLKVAEELNPLLLKEQVVFSDKSIGLRQGLWMLKHSGLGTDLYLPTSPSNNFETKDAGEVIDLTDNKNGVAAINQIISSQLSRSLAAGKASGSDIRPICAILDDSNQTPTRQLAQSYDQLLSNLYSGDRATARTVQQKLDLWSS